MTVDQTELFQYNPDVARVRTGWARHYEPLSKEETEEIQRLHQDASSGPWIAVDNFSGENWMLGSFGADQDGKEWTLTTDHVRASEVGGGTEEDCRLAARYRTLMPKAMATIEALQAKLKAIEEVTA